MRGTLVVRARILSVFFIVIALLIVARLYLVQVVHGQEYRRNAMGQYVQEASEVQGRGSIYFTTKGGSLVAAAAQKTGWRIAINPKDLGDAEAAYAAMHAITPIDRERFFASAAKTNDPYEEVAFRLDDQAAALVRELKLPGVTLAQDEWRFYPGEELAAQIVGFVGYKGDRKTGVYGLERQWQDTLGKRSEGLYVNPFAEIFTNVQAIVTDDPSAYKGDIITSIEPTVQRELEKTLEGVQQAYAPRVVGGIVMEPKTGKIIAMGLRPSFDLNAYNAVSNPATFGNPLVEGRYELGSIMKPITMAIGLDTGAVSESTTYKDAGCITRSTKQICNFDHKARGVVPMQEVLNQSLNTGATFVAEKVGSEAFTRYLRAFFGSKTGIDLPGEVGPELSPLGEGREPAVNYAAASFGQGVAMSPVAMIRALAALGNGGVMVTPHVVTGIRYETGITRSVEPPEGLQILKPETSERISRMLAEVYDDALLDGRLKMEHYSIAAKTGTAQMAIPGGGGYSPDRYLHSFFGYLPAHEPRYIVFLFTVEPHGAEFASATLAQPFSEVAEFLINYFDIPPDR